MTISGPVNEQTYTKAIDDPRINPQRESVRLYMLEHGLAGMWSSLSEISYVLGYPEASVSARLRDFRKQKFGRHQVDRRRRKAGRGTWEYKVIFNKESEDV